MDIERFNPDECTAVAATVLQRRDRRLTYIGLILFAVVTVALIYVWLDRTAGERTCKKWMRNGEPRLEAFTIKITSRWQPGEVTCNDEEAIRYFEACLNAAIPLAPTPSNRYYRNECTIVLRFANGTEYRSPGPCEITAEGIQLPLPDQERLSDDVSTTRFAFQEPMPDSWKHVLNTLLGSGTVE